MLRTTCLTAALALFTLPSFAGLYVGAAIGPEGLSFTQRAHVTRATAPGNFDVIDTNHFAGTGIFGSLFAGYAWLRDRYYLAGEINANLSSVEHRLTNQEFIRGTVSKTTFRVKNSEGISILPGFFVTPGTLFYARVGYVNGRIDINESDPTIESIHKNSNGVRYGLGIRHALTPRWIAMMEWSQVNYGNLKSSVYEPFGGVNKDTLFTPNTGQVAFGLIYNFDVPPVEIMKD